MGLGLNTFFLGSLCYAWVATWFRVRGTLAMLLHATNRVLREAARKPIDQIKTLSFTVRCLIEKKGDIWQAFTLEFGLAVQGDSEADVHRRLDSVICSYVSDAVFGDERQHSEELLARRATAEVYAKYYFYYALPFFFRIGKDQAAARAYLEPLALEGGMCSPC
jgi:hypothetical protein